ncbi:hypothetical protein DPMN_184986 [Dreissena polymorpha]|uniref:Uncharacterized protein n=1 Tax=Dreissena polymorpha TaxID=45954 RepID=A0A9D4DK31_DREPO|nr:hypothetical protein DPMN_184986 [Dreissena polymorpha]
MAKPTNVRDWNIQGLPSDSFLLHGERCHSDECQSLAPHGGPTGAGNQVDQKHGGLTGYS